ncbi:MAG: 50S ribosomal protein L15 [Planctomycetes bacterium]|jgi:large subunit ribosomal protein L15|nr:50S ribosomal protein L15 [Planctomycetota bacterium]
MKLTDVLARSGPRQRKRRVGRGESSGAGKTSGRGAKGAKARSGWGGMIAHEGGQMPIIRRLPKKGFSNILFRKEYAILNVLDLERHFAAGEEVSPEAAKLKGIMKKREMLLKILGKGEIGKALMVKAHRFSVTAREKVEKAGGTVVILE